MTDIVMGWFAPRPSACTPRQSRQTTRNEVGAGSESCKRDGLLILLQLAAAARPASLGSGGNWMKTGVLCIYVDVCIYKKMRENEDNSAY